MTVIRPNSVSGITSITAQANEINVFRSNGTLAGLNLNGVNFNTTAGISTLAALKVTGNVDIAGVLTYQDVTNVDSLGIGTFRTGINVSGGQLDVGSNIKLGNAGVITATSFVGSGAQLTGLPATTTINSNTNNYLITGTGTANTLQGESNLTFDGKTLTTKTTSYPETTEFTTEFKAGVANGNRYLNRYIKITNTYTGSAHGAIPIVWEANANGSNEKSYGSIGMLSDGAITFYSRGAGAAANVGSSLGMTEKLRIGNDGKLVTYGTGAVNAEFNTSNSSGAYIQFDLSASGATTGYIGAGQQIVTGAAIADFGIRSQSNMVFSTGGSTERLRITSDGDILINQPPEASGRLTIRGSGAYTVGNSGKALEGLDIQPPTVGNNNYGGAISLGCGGNGRSAIAAIQEGSDDDKNGLSFFTHNTNVGSDNTVEKLRITSLGVIQQFASGGDNQFVTKRTGTTSSNGDYFFHLTARNNNDDIMGNLGFYRDSANDDARFSIKTRNNGGSSTERFQIDSLGRASFSKNGWVGNDMSFALTVHTGSTSDSNNAVNDGIMIVSQNNNSNQNSTTGKLMFCGHAQTNGPFMYAKNEQAYGKKALVFNTRSTANSYSTQLEETMRLTYQGFMTMNRQPGFGASNMNGWSNIGGSTYAVTSYGTVHHNYGSHFNSSNGRFTAPVDGRYLMTAIGMGVNNSNPHIAFGINNSSNGGGPSRGGTNYGNNDMWSHPSNSGYWVCLTHILDLSANDYVRVYTYDWNSSQDAPRTYFYGYLLG